MRLDMEDSGYIPPLPELVGYGHLLQHLFDVGPTISGESITHSEIRAWMDNTGFELTSWETTALRHLSREFVVQLEASKKMDCPVPEGAYEPAPVLSREQVADQLRSYFTGIIGEPQDRSSDESR